MKLQEHGWSDGESTSSDFENVSANAEPELEDFSLLAGVKEKAAWNETENNGTAVDDMMSDVNQALEVETLVESVNVAKLMEEMEEVSGYLTQEKDDGNNKIQKILENEEVEQRHLITDEMNEDDNEPFSGAASGNRPMEEIVLDCEENDSMGDIDDGTLASLYDGMVQGTNVAEPKMQCHSNTANLQDTANLGAKVESYETEHDIAMEDSECPDAKSSFTNNIVSETVTEYSESGSDDMLTEVQKLNSECPDEKDSGTKNNVSDGSDNVLFSVEELKDYKCSDVKVSVTEYNNSEKVPESSVSFPDETLAKVEIQVLEKDETSEIHTRTCAENGSQGIEVVATLSENGVAETEPARSLDVSSALEQVSSLASHQSVPPKAVALEDSGPIKESAQTTTSIDLLERDFKRINCDKLLELLDNAKTWGSQVEGSDILVLLGFTGAGKTTTLLHLAGVEFDEIDADNGCFHLEPKKYPTDALRDFKTHWGAESVTDSVQGFPVKLPNGKTVVICDGPGLNDTRSIEVEISNRIGMIQAIRQAKNIKPVVVLSVDSFGSRFTELKNILNQISNMTEGLDFSSFSYVFTKVESEKMATRIPKILASLRKPLGQDPSDGRLVALLDDMVAKSTPRAMLIEPLTDDPQTTLQAIFSETSIDLGHDESFFKWCLSDTTSNSLRVELQFLVKEVKSLVDDQDFISAEAKMRKLLRLAAAIPEVSSAYAKEGREVGSFFASQSRNIIEQGFAQISTLRRNEFDALKSLAEDIKQHFRILFKADDFLAESRVSRKNRHEAIADAVSHHIEKYVSEVSIVKTSPSPENINFFVSSLSSFQFHMTCLYILKDAFDEHHLGSLTNSAYIEASGRLPVILDGFISFQKFREVETFEMMHNFLRKIADDLQNHIYIDERDCGNWRFFSDKVARFLSDFTAFAKQERDSLSSASNSLESFLRSKITLESLVDLRSKDLCRSRKFLISLSKARDLKNWNSVGRLVDEFNSNLTKYFEVVANYLDERANDFMETGIEDCTFESRKAEVNAMIEKLDESCLHCKRFRSSADFQVPIYDDIWEKMVATKKLLSMYSQGLDEEAVALKQGVKGATCAASEFLNLLQSESRPLSELLPTLFHAENWDCWVALIPEQDETASTMGRLAVLWKSISGQKKNMNKLKATLDKIVFIIGDKIEKSLSRVIEGLEDKSKLFTARFLLEADSNDDLFLCFEVYKIRQDSSLMSWIRNIKSPHYFDKAVLRSQSAVTHGFQTLSQLPRELFSNRRFQDLGFILQLWKRSSIWTESRSFSRIILSLKPSAGTPEDWQKLRESIDACPDYKFLCGMCTKAKQDASEELNNVTFDNILNAKNDIDRLNYYKGVLKQMKKADDLRALVPHIGDAKDVEDFSDRYARKVIEETNKIGSKLLELISSFPDNEEDFTLIKALIANLESIGISFRDADSSITVFAYDFVATSDSCASVKLEELGKFAPRSKKDMIKDLFKFKKASREIPKWSQGINTCIDQRLASFVQNKRNSACCLLEISISLRNETGDLAPLAKQLLAEHKCFEGAVNAMFNEATSRQGVDYVLRHLEPALTLRETSRMLSLHAQFLAAYKELVQEGILNYREGGDGPRDVYLSDLVRKAKKYSEDFSLTYEEQVVKLTSSIFAYWSLKRSNAFMASADSNDNATSYLLQPHAAQVIAVWLLVNTPNSEHQRMRNQLCEVKTGEGKSVVLAVTAIILSMLGWEVNCICYSSYLSRRDFAAFEDIFKAFDVSDSVWYGTLNDLTRSLVGDYCDESYRVFRNQPFQAKSTINSGRPKVLLFDEADVFFKDDVFGTRVRPSLDLRDEKVFKFFVHLFDHRPHSDESAVKARIREICNDFPAELRPAIEKELCDASLISCAFHRNAGFEYEIISGEIAYKYMDGYSTTIRYGHWTTFSYIKEWKNGRLTEDQAKAAVALLPTVGQVSPAEFPFNYEVILGVTGTLKGLGENEREILKTRYGIANYAYIPSVFGENKLRFAEENESDFILCSDRQDFSLKLANEIRARRSSRNGGSDIIRPVIVFFESKKALEEFYNSSPMQQLRHFTQTITEHIQEGQKDAVFQKATEQGEVSLMIKEYGRGTDFKCFDSVLLREGGVHVIQSFFSIDFSEEIQIRGRCARQGEDGSFSMVLNFEQLSRDLELTLVEFNRMRSQRALYSFLNRKREAKVTGTVQERLQKVEEAEELHYRTLACRDALLCGVKEFQREAMRFICELNGCNGSNAFKENGLKPSMLARRHERLEALEGSDESKRREAREALVQRSTSARLIKVANEESV